MKCFGGVYLHLAINDCTREVIRRKVTKEGLDMVVIDNQVNLLSIGQVRKRTCYLLQCIEVIRIDVNGRDIIKRFVCQNISLEH